MSDRTHTSLTILEGHFGVCGISVRGVNFVRYRGIGRKNRRYCGKLSQRGMRYCTNINMQISCVVIFLIKYKASSKPTGRRKDNAGEGGPYSLTTYSTQEVPGRRALKFFISILGGNQSIMRILTGFMLYRKL